MNNSEATLSIILSLIDNATTQLQEAQGAFAQMGTAAQDAAAQVTDALTPAEQAVVAQAESVAQAWEDASGAISTSMVQTAPTIDGMLQGLMESNQQAAAEVTAVWQQQAQAMQDDLTAALTAVEDDAANTSAQVTSTLESSGSSFHGYFRQLIAGYMLQQGGQFLTGMVQSTVNAAAGNPLQIQQLTDQITQQRAAIATHEAELLRWQGTIQQVAAAHQTARADIAAETTKIEELQRQLTPLEAAQKAAGDAQVQYALATQQLNADWQAFLATVGLPLLENLTKLAVAIDGVVQKLTAWAQAHPELTTYLLTFIGILGTIMTVLGTLMLVLAPIIILIGMFGASFVAIAVVVVVAVAAIGAAIATHWQQITTLTTQVVTDFRDAWNTLTMWWTKFWDGIFTTIESAWTKIQGIVSAIETAISKVTGPITSIAGAVGGTISGAIKAFASGGIVTGPTLAMVGEAGPEAIIPLSSFTGGSGLAGAGSYGGAGNIQVFIQGGTYLDQNGASMIANALATQIGRQLKLKNYY